MKRLFCFLLIFSAFIPNAIAQQFNKYDTRNDVKAKGLWLTVKYPRDWKAEDGNRPNIVKKFTRSDGNTMEGLMLQVKDLPNGADSEISMVSAEEWSKSFFESMSSTARASNVKKIRHEGEIGFIGDVTFTDERAAHSVYQSQRIMTVFYKGKMITQYCSTAGYINNKSLVDSKQHRNKDTICQIFFNSLVLMDKYK